MKNCLDIKVNRSDAISCRLEKDVKTSYISNVYYHLDKNKFIELFNLCLNNRNGYMSYLRHSKKYLLEWVDSVLPSEIFNDNFYSKHLSTKLHFIFHGLRGYPRCIYCKKEIRMKKCRNLFNNHLLDFCCMSCQSKFFWPQISSSKIQNGGDLWNYKKCKETWNKKYGTDNPMQDIQCQFKHRKKYFFNNVNFDSKPEISFYIYLNDNKINFKYQPKQKFIFVFNRKEYTYFPDFIVEGKVVELKGDHFFKNGKMICPFKKKEWSDERYQEECNKYEAKHQCMIANGVTILTSKDYQKYLDYVDQKYGKKYLDQFRK